MSTIEEPGDVVVVSRREWMRISTLAAAALGVPSVASAAGPAPTDGSCQSCFYKLDGGECFSQPWDSLNDYKSSKSCEYGLLAAFLSCVTRDDTNHDIEQTLMGFNDQTSLKSKALAEALGLDYGKWNGVVLAVTKSGTYTPDYVALREAARALWSDMSSTYNGHYAPGHCTQNAQIINVSFIPGHVDENGKDTTGDKSKVKTQNCA